MYVCVCVCERETGCLGPSQKARALGDLLCKGSIEGTFQNVFPGVLLPPTRQSTSTRSGFTTFFTTLSLLHSLLHSFTTLSLLQSLYYSLYYTFCAKLSLLYILYTLFTTHSLLHLESWCPQPGNLLQRARRLTR